MHSSCYHRNHEEVGEKEWKRRFGKGKRSIKMREAFQRALKKKRTERRTYGRVRGDGGPHAGREGAAPEMVQKCAQLSAAQWQTVMKQAKK